MGYDAKNYVLNPSGVWVPEQADADGNVIVTGVAKTWRHKPYNNTAVGFGDLVFAGACRVRSFRYRVFLDNAGAPVGLSGYIQLFDKASAPIAADVPWMSEKWYTQSETLAGAWDPNQYYQLDESFWTMSGSQDLALGFGVGFSYGSAGTFAPLGAPFNVFTSFCAAIEPL